MKVTFSIVTVVLNNPEGLLATAQSVIQQTSKNVKFNVCLDFGLKRLEKT